MRSKKKKVIKNKEISALTYHGEVTIQKIYKGKVVSSTKSMNAGYEPLFKFILLCLAGRLDDSLLPFYVIPVNIDTNTSKISYADSICTTIASQEVKKESDSSKNYLEYKFYLPFKSVYQSIGFNSLALYSKQYAPYQAEFGAEISENYSMLVTFSDTQKSNKEDLLIIWQLFIDNKN